MKKTNSKNKGFVDPDTLLKFSMIIIVLLAIGTLLILLVREGRPLAELRFFS